MKCRSRDVLDYYVLTSENAYEVLEAIGFGKEMCAQTYERDHRYGRVTKFGIEYGFEANMHGEAKYGKYFVHECNDWGMWNQMSKDDFFEEYEPIE